MGKWIALGVVGIVLIIIVMKEQTPNPNLYNTSTAQVSAGIGGFLGGLFKATSAAPTKVSLPNSSTVQDIPPGSSGTNGGTDYNFNATTGSQYSAAMASTGEVASMNAGSGGATASGGLTNNSSTDPFGIGQLSNPGFATGTMGVDFSAS